MSDTVKLGYSSNKNITFRGELDTGIEREEWDTLSEKEQDEVLNDMIWELVQLHVKDE